MSINMLRQLDKEVRDKDLRIKTLIIKNEEEIITHERQMMEFRCQMNRIIDSMKKNNLEKENTYQVGLEKLNEVINYQKILYSQVT